MPSTDSTTSGQTALPGEYRYIIELVEPGTKVLDLGCGNGDLLQALQVGKKVFPQGVEISEECIQECVSRGLPVYMGDLDEGLADYTEHALDYVILTNVIQVLHRPDFLIREAARVGRKVIVSFPNFAFWQGRLQLALKGEMPRTKVLPYEWYNSPNIHLTTIKDFYRMCRQEKFTILQRIFLRTGGNGEPVRVKRFPNLLASQAIFVITRETEDTGD